MSRMLVHDLLAGAGIASTARTPLEPIRQELASTRASEANEAAKAAGQEYPSARRLEALARSQGLDVAEVLRLHDGSALDDHDDKTVAAYALALHERAQRERGCVPTGWSKVCQCDGCGPIWLDVGCPDRVIACPWCWNRVAGLPVPQPEGDDE